MITRRRCFRAYIITHNFPHCRWCDSFVHSWDDNARHHVGSRLTEKGSTSNKCTCIYNTYTYFIGILSHVCRRPIVNCHNFTVKIRSARVVSHGVTIVIINLPLWAYVYLASYFYYLLFYSWSFLIFIVHRNKLYLLSGTFTPSKYYIGSYYS